MRIGVESRVWILGLTRSDPDAMPPDRSTNRSRPALLRIKSLLLELNCAGVRRIGLWGMQRGRSKHGRLRKESVLGWERERALNAFQLHRGRRRRERMSRLLTRNLGSSRLFDGSRSWQLGSAWADENTSWACECDCVNSDVLHEENCYGYQTRWLRYHHLAISCLCKIVHPWFEDKLATEPPVGTLCVISHRKYFLFLHFNAEHPKWWGGALIIPNSNKNSTPSIFKLLLLLTFYGAFDYLPYSKY
jgi:hypothetical protein